MKEVEEFIAFLYKITEQEERQIETFSQRVAVLYDHQVIIERLIAGLASVKDGKSGNSALEALALIKRKVLPAFAPLDPELEAELRSERKEEVEFVQVELADLDRIKRDFASGDSYASQKIKHIISEVSTELVNEQKVVNATTHLIESLENLRLVHQELIAQLTIEQDLIIQTQKTVREHDPLAIDGSIQAWREVGKNIDSAVRREKETVAHLTHLFDEKFSAGRIVERYAKPRGFLSFLHRRATITKKDIERDISTLASTDEFLLYMGSLIDHMTLLSPEAQKYLKSETIQESIRSRKERSKLKTEAHIDTLTKLYSRATVLTRFAEEVARFNRTSRPFSIIFYDIDKFGDFNKFYTHAVGDVVLANVARYILEGKRAADIAFRFGGEEIMILLPQCTREDAYNVADRIRNEIVKKSTLLMADINVKVTLPEGVKPRNNITVSGGIVEYPADGKEFSDLVKVASARLTKAKDSGRNKILYSDAA